MTSEIFWLSIALIIVIAFSYKPVKAFIEKFINTQINQTRKLIEDAQKVHSDAEARLKKIEKEFNYQSELNKKKLEQTKQRLDLSALESQKKLEVEIGKQLEMAEAARKISEEVVKKEIMSIIMAERINSVVGKFKKKKERNTEYINNSLEKLDSINIAKNI